MSIFKGKLFPSFIGVPRKIGSILKREGLVSTKGYFSKPDKSYLYYTAWDKDGKTIAVLAKNPVTKKWAIVPESTWKPSNIEKE